jgi:hypothetical protein
LWIGDDELERRWGEGEREGKEGKEEAKGYELR